MNIRTVLLSCLTICAVGGPSGVAEADDTVLASPTRLVDPLIGTGGNRLICANNPPGAMRPFGMVRLSPDTVSVSGETATNMSGYFYDDPYILGFSHTRLCGTGAIEGGHFRVVPGVDAEQRREVRLEFDHRHESASPGYYSVDLPSVGVKAELSANCRTGVHRYTFSEGTVPRILIDVGSTPGRGRSDNCEVHADPTEKHITGSARTFGTFSGRYGGLKAYFAARVSQPWTSCSTWTGDEFNADSTKAAGDDVGIALTFDPSSDGQPIELFVALSYVSVENAKENLTRESGFSRFDDIQRSAETAWNDLLSSVRVEGGTASDQKIFYTGLYRCCMMPTVFNDTNGDYFGFDRNVHRADGFNYYTDMSLWDTFRTTHPLYTLLLPDRHRDMLVSLVKMAEQGGNLPRWPSGAGYTNSMFGAPAEIAVAEAYVKGIRDFDVETAYRVMRRAALEPAPKDAAYSGRRGIADYIQYGYCPSDTMSGAVAKTLEYATADAAISRLARELGHTEDAELFARRAQNYRNLWNPETQYFQPKDTAGEFSTPLSPTLLTYVDFSKKFTDDYVEGSALQWRWAVSHDAPGLISLFSDKEYFVSELDAFFAGSTSQVGALPNGYYWQGNQPDIHAVYLFNDAERPDLTQKWVRWILKHKHDDTPVGLNGNDDGGTLSAWYVFSSLGFYPVVGTDRYEIGSPLWDRAVLNVAGGVLEIIAENNSPDNVYVERVALNGQPLDRWWFTHDEIVNGGTLRFVMSHRAATP